MLEFINKYKDILFFEEDNCKMFSVDNLVHNYAEVKLNDISMTRLIFFGEMI